MLITNQWLPRHTGRFSQITLQIQYWPITVQQIGVRQTSLHGVHRVLCTQRTDTFYMQCTLCVKRPITNIAAHPHNIFVARSTYCYTVNDFTLFALNMCIVGLCLLIIFTRVELCSDIKCLNKFLLWIFYRYVAQYIRFVPIFLHSWQLGGGRKVYMINTSRLWSHQTTYAFLL